MTIKIAKAKNYAPDRVEPAVRSLLSDLLPTGFPPPSSRRSPLVVVKPNWVEDSHVEKPEVWEPVITHPNVILAVVDVLAERMDGRGTICVCDAPNTYVDFDAVTRRGDFADRLNARQKRWPLLRFELLDLRREVWLRRGGVVIERRPLAPDPQGYVRIDLGRDSLLYGHKGEGRYYGADYDTGVVNAHHQGDTHEYLLAGTPMRCDLFVNVPKLKTHKKTGLTCCLKNLVGINGDKNWLPHFVQGSPDRGGDEYPDSRLSSRLEMLLKKKAQEGALKRPVLGTWTYRGLRKFGQAILGGSDQVIRGGNWHGNDTCWRMALDLNRAFLYGNADGSLRECGRRPYVCIVDGIVAGEGNGPLSPDPVESGVLIGGTDPAAVDAVACQLMGFDPDRIPMVREAFAERRWRISSEAMQETKVEGAFSDRECSIAGVRPAVTGGFRPHFGWVNEVEARER